jgi:hypothetical protein
MDTVSGMLAGLVLLCGILLAFTGFPRVDWGRCCCCCGSVSDWVKLLIEFMHFVVIEYLLKWVALGFYVLGTFTIVFAEESAAECNVAISYIAVVAISIWFVVLSSRLVLA